MNLNKQKNLEEVSWIFLADQPMIFAMIFFHIRNLFLSLEYKNVLHLNVYFQIKLKIQNEKLNPLPDPFALDWDNLSETEMKRLVGQLEKTK